MGVINAFFVKVENNKMQRILTPVQNSAASGG